MAYPDTALLQHLVIKQKVFNMAKPYCVRYKYSDQPIQNLPNWPYSKATALAKGAICKLQHPEATVFVESLDGSGKIIATF